MEQYTLPIMRYTNEIWDILYPEASKDEWSWMNNVHSSADAAIIQMHMARQSAHYPKKTGESAVCGNRPGVFPVDWYDNP